MGKLRYLMNGALDGFSETVDHGLDWTVVENVPSMPAADDDGYVTFYAANFDRVARAVRSWVGPDANDIAQEALLVARDRWVEVQGLEQPVAWVIRVALRMATRRAQRERKRPHVEVAAQANLSVPPPDLDLVAAILGLPDRQAAAVRLHHLEDRPVAELAERQPRFDSEASQASRSSGLGPERGRVGGFSPIGL